ncbi:MAG TPA: glycosyltransferase [Gammaproteobacteria bacterium]|nr:glycosyltransferase [Gammaproteobacteria bacterium]
MDSASTGGALEIGNARTLPEQPIVSVFMATYNQERYIAAAIEGALAQKVDFPIELVVGEDCSTDGTRAIVLDYQRKHPDLIRIISGSRNAGGFANSNRCLPLCRAKYIAFCEGDDFWHHAEKLKMQVAAMNASPDITLCHTDYNRKIGFRTNRDAHKRHRGALPAEGDAYLSLLHDWTVMTATAMYRADIIRDFLATPFNNPSWPFGDYNKALYASVRGRLAYVPVSTATWRKRMGSATNSGYQRFLAMALAYSECREAFMAEFPPSLEVAESVRRDSRERIMPRAFYAGATDTFEDCRRWLVEHGYARGASRYRLMRAIMGNRPLLATVGKYRALVQTLGTLGG